MKRRFDPNLKRDLFKLSFLFFITLGAAAIFLVTPSLSTPVLLAGVLTLLLSPMVAMMERNGYPRSFSILVLYFGFGLIFAVVGFFIFRAGYLEWGSFRGKAIEYFQKFIEKSSETEAHLKLQYPVLDSMNITEGITKWGDHTGAWFAKRAPTIATDLLSYAFLVPLFTYFFLSEGRRIKRGFFHLVPNRFFESFFLMSNEIGSAISGYLRAKLIEAFLVGVITWFGLMLIGAPYSVVLGIVSGVTNVIPYVGPVLGSLPGLLLFFMDPELNRFLWPALTVYVIANLVDTIVLFPLVVAKLVNLHPLLILAAVALGQRYYGLIGMLISVPLASAMKVILLEVYAAIYSESRVRVRRI